MADIPFVVADVEVDEENTKGWMGLLSDRDVGLRQVPSETLQKNLTSVTQAITAVLEDVRAVGRFRLQEVELQVEITAEGGVNLIGTAMVGGSGAIRLKFVE